MPDQPSGERTEQATPKRMEEARREGRIQRSRDMPSSLLHGSRGADHPGRDRQRHLRRPRSRLGVQARSSRIPPRPVRRRRSSAPSGRCPGSSAPILAAAVVGAVAGSLVAGGFHMKRFKPHVDQFDLVKGAGRLVGRQALWEGAKAILRPRCRRRRRVDRDPGRHPLAAFQGLGRRCRLGRLSSASGVIVAILQSAIVAGIVLGALDVLVVTRRNRQHTMMTRQEIKDEAKSTEGDPHIRQHRRSRQIAISRNRMMAAISGRQRGGAGTRRTSPSRSSTDQGKSAPRVVAKGAGEIAAKIRESAAEHRVPRWSRTSRSPERSTPRAR